MARRFSSWRVTGRDGRDWCTAPPNGRWGICAVGSGRPPPGGQTAQILRGNGWSGDQSATQLALALEGTAVQVLLDLAPADQRNLQALTRALERRFGQRAVADHSRELLADRPACTPSVGTPPTLLRSGRTSPYTLSFGDLPRNGWDSMSDSPGPRPSMLRSTRRSGQKESFPAHPACSRPVPPDLTSGRRTTVSRMRMGRRFSRPGLRPSAPDSGHHPPTDVRPGLTGAVSGAGNQAIWPVTALPRHHGLDPFVQRETTDHHSGNLPLSMVGAPWLAALPVPGASTSTAGSTADSARPWWTRGRPSPWCVRVFFRVPPAHSRGGGRRPAVA